MSPSYSGILQHKLRSPCASVLRSAETAPRVDAQATETRTGVGGWWPVVDESGVPDPARSPWFSLEVTKEQWPWVYAKSERPALVISTLESLAVLLALKCFFQGRNSEHDIKVQILPTWTDSRGNGSVLNKLMTTRYPASAVLMEMSVFMKRHKLKANVEWAPREANKEADELANGDVHQFSPALEVKMWAEELDWYILPKVLEIGARAEEAHLRAKQTGVLPNRTQKQRKRKPEERLQNRDP